jgi:hypothetical protein
VVLTFAYDCSKGPSGGRSKHSRSTQSYPRQFAKLNQSPCESPCSSFPKFTTPTPLSPDPMEEQTLRLARLALLLGKSSVPRGRFENSSHLFPNLRTENTMRRGPCRTSALGRANRPQCHSTGSNHCAHSGVWSEPHGSFGCTFRSSVSATFLGSNRSSTYFDLRSIRSRALLIPCRAARAFSWVLSIPSRRLQILWSRSVASVSCFSGIGVGYHWPG